MWACIHHRSTKYTWFNMWATELEYSIPALCYYYHCRCGPVYCPIRVYSQRIRRAEHQPWWCHQCHRQVRRRVVAGGTEWEGGDFPCHICAGPVIAVYVYVRQCVAPCTYSCSTCVTIVSVCKYVCFLHCKCFTLCTGGLVSRWCLCDWIIVEIQPTERRGWTYYGSVLHNIIM